MNKCRYCNVELKTEDRSYEICKCEKSQRDWKINMDIQQLKSELSTKQRALSELRESQEKKE